MTVHLHFLLGITRVRRTFQHIWQCPEHFAVPREFELPEPSLFDQSDGVE